MSRENARAYVCTRIMAAAGDATAVVLNSHLHGLVLPSIVYSTLRAPFRSFASNNRDDALASDVGGALCVSLTCEILQFQMNTPCRDTEGTCVSEMSVRVGLS